MKFGCNCKICQPLKGSESITVTLRTEPKCMTGIRIELLWQLRSKWCSLVHCHKHGVALEPGYNAYHPKGDDWILLYGYQHLMPGNRWLTLLTNCPPILLLDPLLSTSHCNCSVKGERAVGGGSPCHTPLHSVTEPGGYNSVCFTTPCLENWHWQSWGGVGV